MPAGCTPLMLASRLGQLGVLKQLLACGASRSAVDAQGRNSAAQALAQAAELKRAVEAALSASSEDSAEQLEGRPEGQGAAACQWVHWQLGPGGHWQLQGRQY